MTIETTVEPYELLIRWKGGQISGLHKRELITVKDGDVTLSQSEGKATGIDPADVPAFFPAADAVAEVSRLMGELAERDDQIAELTNRIDVLEVSLGEAEKKLEHLVQG